MPTTADPLPPARTEGPSLARFAGPLLGPFVGTYAFNSASVASPSIARDLGASPTQVEIVIAAYSVPFAVLLVLGGRLGDRYGRRRTFALGMGLFTAAAAAAAAAPDASTLAAIRLVQGAGAALCTPQVLGTVQATSHGVRRARGVMLFGASAGVGLAAGQLGGGLLLGTASPGTGWRLTFVTCAVVGVVSVALATSMPPSRSNRPADVDLVGTISLGLVVLCLVVPLTFGPTWGWPWWNEAVAALGLGLAFVLWAQQGRVERAGRVPLLPPSIVSLRPLRLGLVAVAVYFGGFGGMLFVFTRTLEGGLGLSPFGAGSALGPFAVAFVVVSLALGSATRRLGHRTSVVGFAAMTVLLLGAAATTWVQWGPQTPWLLQPWLVLLGASQGLVFSPLVSLVLAEVPDEAAGLSGALLSTMQQLALALGVILVGSASAGLAQHVGVAPAAATELTTAFGLFAVCSAVGLGLVVSILRRDASSAARVGAP